MGQLNKHYIKIQDLYEAKNNLEQKYRNRPLDVYYHSEAARLRNATNVFLSQVMHVGKGTVYLVNLSQPGVEKNYIFDSSNKKGKIIITGMDKQDIEDWAKFNKLVITNMTKIPTMQLLNEEQLKQLTE